MYTFIFYCRYSKGRLFFPFPTQMTCMQRIFQLSTFQLSKRLNTFFFLIMFRDEYLSTKYNILLPTKKKTRARVCVCLNLRFFLLNAEAWSNFGSLVPNGSWKFTASIPFMCVLPVTDKDGYQTERGGKSLLRAAFVEGTSTAQNKMLAREGNRKRALASR